MSDVKFTSNKRAVMGEAERMAGGILSAVCMAYDGNAVGYITQRGHVDTGLMRASQTHQLDLQNKQGIVGNTAEYAVHVEMPGLTRRWDGGKFMQDALNNYLQEYQQEAEAAARQYFN